MGESGWEKLGRGWAANKSKDAVANFRNASVERVDLGRETRLEGRKGGRIWKGFALFSRDEFSKVERVGINGTCKKEKLVDG